MKSEWIRKWMNARVWGRAGKVWQLTRCVPSESVSDRLWSRLRGRTDDAHDVVFDALARRRME